VFLAEGVFTISMTERTMLFNSEANQETKTVLTKNGGKVIAFTPNSVLVIAQDDNSGYCLGGGGDSHPF
jgi:hypothetical protein